MAPNLSSRADTAKLVGLRMTKALGGIPIADYYLF